MRCWVLWKYYRVHGVPVEERASGATTKSLQIVGKVLGHVQLYEERARGGGGEHRLTGLGNPSILTKSNIIN